MKTLSTVLFFVFFSAIAACSESTSVNTDTDLVLEVFKTPTCGCCGQWVNHMETAGFGAAVVDLPDLSDLKSKHGIAPKYQSCHTAVSGGYVFEGHIPATVVKRFLAETPDDAIGLAVPGMPIGSPGMEMNNRHDDYDVLLLKKDGSAVVYQHISGAVTSNDTQ